MSDMKIISKSQGTHEDKDHEPVIITMERFTLWGRFKDNRAPAQWSEKSADGFYKLYDRYNNEDKWGVERDIPAVIEDWKSDGLIEWKIYRLKQTVTEEIYKVGIVDE